MHFDKILITTDFSDLSYQAFDITAYEKKMEDVEVRLLYVFQYSYAPVTFGDIPIPPVGSEAHENIRNEFQKKLEKLVDRYFHGQKIITEVVCSVDSPGDAICFYAQQHASELIIMASKGHSALGALFTGSTVQRVLLKSKCPVMVVPTKG